MPVRDWLEPPRQMLVVFFAVALASTVTLGWLTWELMALDRDAELRRVRDALEQTADGISAALDRRLAALERRLDLPSASDGAPVPAGAALMTIRGDAIDVRPAGALPFLPDVARAPTPASPAWQAAMRAELVDRNLTAALRAYGTFAREGDSRTRAAAMTRMASVERKLRRWSDALATYDELEALGDVHVEGLPGQLVARLGRVAVFEASGKLNELRAEALRLKDDLEQGRLSVTRSQFDLYSAEVAGWVGTAPVVDREAIARADAVRALAHGEELAAGTGRRLIVVGSDTAFVLWRRQSAPGDLTVLTMGPEALRQLIDDVAPDGVTWSISDPFTQAAMGTVPDGRDVAARPAETTGLPWTLQVFAADPAVTGTSPRRRLLLAVLVSVGGLVLAGWYFIWRGISREIRLARLQSDFVAAVSHEFRSPLTSLGHIADLLATGRVGTEERKQRSYELLRGQTARLGQLVESLLDFKQMQEGQLTFRFEEEDPARLVRRIVDDFERQFDGGQHRIDLTAGDSLPPVRVDRDVFARALWNLLDNAVKYSPPPASVAVSVAAGGPSERVEITVKDEGPGIPAEEQPRIFERFVRGADAKARRVRGTGIGLTMARDIVRAHGGDLTVASAPGAGSAFTIVLPAHVPEGVEA